MLKPNKKRIKLWYNALMRAKKQTTSCLKDKDGRCCLGVACDVFKNNTGRGKWVNDLEEIDFKVGKQRSCSRLPFPVAKWFGLEDGDPYLDEIDKYHASNLNDDQGYTFKQIAKKIKEKFLD